jgi:hypothetical protein
VETDGGSLGGDVQVGWVPVRAARLVPHIDPEAADVFKDLVDHAKALRALVTTSRMHDDTQQLVGKKVFKIGNLLVGKRWILRKAQGVLDSDNEFFDLFLSRRSKVAYISTIVSTHVSTPSHAHL